MQRLVQLATEAPGTTENRLKTYTGYMPDVNDDDYIFQDHKLSTVSVIIINFKSDHVKIITIYIITSYIIIIYI